MFGGMNPKKMAGMMKQLGISQEEIPAEKVVIEKADGKIVINNPSVQKIKMQGQESFQIAGDISEQEAVKFNEDDVKQIVEKTGKSEDESRRVLDEVDGDLAEAILKLQD